MIYYILIMAPIVLLFQSKNTKSWRDKLAGVYRYARKAGWQVQVIDARASAQELRETLELWQPIGCIINRASSCASDPVRIFKNIPTVLLDQNPMTNSGRFTTVIHDSKASARLAADELLKSGATAFTYIAGDWNIFWAREREEAFSEAIRTAGRRYVKWRGSFAELPKPCGILCATDMVAQRAMALANRQNIRIPDELLFVGIDNDELICEHTLPTLTSVLPDFEEGGYLVAAALQRAIDGGAPEKLFYKPARIVRRESSRWLGKNDPRVIRALTHIRRHAFEYSLSTDSIVAVMGCSRRSADQRFREVTGRSIHEEIHALRMEKAYALLRTPNQAIGSIANLCGYASEPFFKRLFKRETGMSMREWRKQNASSYH